VVAAMVGLAACAGCAPMDIDEHPPWPPEDGGRAGDLAEQAGCPTGEGEPLLPPSIAGPEGELGWECVADDRWALTLVVGFTPEGVETTVAQLNDRHTSTVTCPDGTPSNPGVASGDDWVAYVSDHEGAAAIAERLGGELRPNEVAGPPNGIVNQLCPV